MTKKIFFLTIFILSLTIFAAAQAKTNEQIDKQIKSLKADKNITLSYYADGGTSKIFAVGEDFGKAQDDRAGLRNFNFGMAFFYAGKSLAAAPDTVNWTFWSYSKNPKFAAAHSLTMIADGETIDLGEARYVSKPGEGREFLNFVVSRANLAKIAKASSVKMKLGAAEFTFTTEHLRTLANVIKISDPNTTN